MAILYLAVNELVRLEIKVGAEVGQLPVGLVSLARVHS